MRREDFEEIRDVHFTVCRSIIEYNGICKHIHCEYCPFTDENNPDCKHCDEKGYSSGGFKDGEDETLVNSAKEFLKFEKNKWVCKECGSEVLAVSYTNGHITSGITDSKEPDEEDVREFYDGLDLYEYICSNYECQNSSKNLDEIVYKEEK